MNPMPIGQFLNVIPIYNVEFQGLSEYVFRNSKKYSKGHLLGFKDRKLNSNFKGKRCVVKCQKWEFQDDHFVAHGSSFHLI